MAQRLIQVEQVASGKAGVTDLGARLTATDAAAAAAQQAAANAEALSAAECAKLNEAVMASATAPVATPVFADIQTYTVLAGDVVAGQPSTITIPNTKKYKPGKGNLLLLRNGVPQTLDSGDFTEASETTIKYNADIVDAGDVLTFIIYSPAALAYTTAVTYFTTGEFTGLIETVTYAGDINRVYTYTYVTGTKKIHTKAMAEGGKTVTETFTYDGTGKLTGTAVVVA